MGLGQVVMVVLRNSSPDFINLADKILSTIISFSNTPPCP